MSDLINTASGLANTAIDLTKTERTDAVNSGIVSGALQQTPQTSSYSEEMGTQVQTSATNISKTLSTSSKTINKTTSATRAVTAYASNKQAAAANLVKTERTDAVNSGLVQGATEKTIADISHKTVNPSLALQSEKAHAAVKLHQKNPVKKIIKKESLYASGKRGLQKATQGSEIDGLSDMATAPIDTYKTIKNAKSVLASKKTVNTAKKSGTISKNSVRKAKSLKTSYQKQALKKRAIRSSTPAIDSLFSSPTTKSMAKSFQAASISSATTPILAPTAATMIAVVTAILSLILLLSAIIGAACNSNSDNGAKIDIPYEENGYLIGSYCTATAYYPYAFANGPILVNTNQYPVNEAWVNAGSVYTEGFATLDGRYLIATTSIFGDVGDRVDFHTNTGDVIPCIIADAKNPNDPGCTKWGHNEGQNVLEFEVNQDYWDYQKTLDNYNPGAQAGSWTIPDARKYYASKESDEPCYLEYAINLERGGNGQEYTAASDEQKAIVDACNSTPFAGSGWCAAWVTNVYTNAGWTPVPTGDACTMYWNFCTSDDRNDLQVGMIIAVPHSPYGKMGWDYGHVGIYIGDNKVMHNGETLQVTDLDDWINEYHCSSEPVKWGYPPK